MPRVFVHLVFVHLVIFGQTVRSSRRFDPLCRRRRKCCVGRRKGGRREARGGETKQGTTTSNARSLPPSLVPPSLSLRFQRESRVYEERVPSHSVFGEEFGGEHASSKSNTRSESDTPLGSFLYTRPICLLLKTAVGGPILLRQRSLSPIRHGPFLRREADGNRDGKRVM